MERWVCAQREICGGHDRFEEAMLAHLPELLQQAAGLPGVPPDGTGGVPVQLSVHLAGIGVHKMVRATVGEATRRDGWLSVPLTWAASPGRALFPSFDGAVELQRLTPATVEVSLVGHYRPPFGPLGGIGDMTVTADLAQRTVEGLLATLTRAIVDRAYGQEAPEPASTGALRVRDVMTGEPMLTFTEDTSVRAAAALLLRAGVSGAPVLDARGHVCGVLSTRDLLDKAASYPLGLGTAAYRAHRRYRAVTVGEACTRPAVTTEADTLVRAAAREMARRDLSRLVVLDGATVVGVVTRTDMLRALTRDDDQVAEAVRATLGDAGHDAVTVEVDGGVAHLMGTVALRSQEPALVATVEAVDGVLDVEADEVAWQRDDVTHAVPVGW